VSLDTDQGALKLAKRNLNQGLFAQIAVPKFLG
jgi:hypothetical protein